MATIKLGNTTLAGFSFGGKTNVVPMSRTKTILRAPKVTQAAANELRGNTDGNQLGGNVGGDSQWLLASGYWDDNGVWDDTQNWTE
jgi:hypothetical protein